MSEICDHTRSTEPLCFEEELTFGPPKTPRDIVQKLDELVPPIGRGSMSADRIYNEQLTPDGQQLIGKMVHSMISADPKADFESPISKVRLHAVGFHRKQIIAYFQLKNGETYRYKASSSFGSQAAESEISEADPSEIVAKGDRGFMSTLFKFW